MIAWLLALILATTTSSDLLPDVNSARASAWLPPVAVDRVLEQIAMERAHYVVDHGYPMSHCIGGEPYPAPCVSGYDVTRRLDARGIVGTENIAEMTLTQNGVRVTTPLNDPHIRHEVHRAWMKSPGHHAAILGPQWRRFGSAELSWPDGRLFMVEVFAR